MTLRPKREWAQTHLISIPDSARISKLHLVRMNVFILSCLIITGFYLIFAIYFPNSNGRLGHDYSYFFPQLLDGKFWFDNNGLFQVPWFTPSFGGGLPKFPNPQSMYYSVPQFLCFFVTPLSSIRFTLLIFGCLGYAGFYFFLRKIFLTSQITALLGATLFLFNGFFVHRMIIGHLPFHSYMLLPIIAFLVLRNTMQNGNWLSGTVRDAAGGGLMLAYTIYSGASQILPPMLLGIMMCGVAYNLYLKGTKIRLYWICKLAFTMLAGLLVSATALNASVSFLKHFPRNLYPLPGIASIPGLLQLTFLSLFGNAPAELGERIIVNEGCAMEQHEFEYGIGFIPLVILLLGAIAFAFTMFKNRTPNKLSTTQLLCVAFLALLFLIPLCLNFYSLSWNVFLKGIPIIRESSSNIRWLCAYIPCVILLACLTIESIGLIKLKMAVILTGIVLILLTNGIRNRDYYNGQEYDPEYIDNAYVYSAGKSLPHEIVRIGTGELFNFDERMIRQRNDVMIAGYSQMYPYEPIFGYRLENFPIKTLRPGLVMQDSNGVLNLKNPASYVFPQENNCSPGDHFTLIQKENADKFRKYLKYSFAISTRQRYANDISAISISAVLGYLLFLCFLTIKRNIASYCQKT